MRLMISVIDSRANWGTPDELVAFDAFNDRLTDAGHWVRAGGLAAPDRSVVIDGMLQHNGMVSFKSALKPADADAIRHYVIKRANEDKALGLK